MKRWLAVAVVLAGLVAVACGDDDDENGQNTPLIDTGGVRPSSQCTDLGTDGNAPGLPPIDGDLQTTASCLRYIDEQVGDGATPRNRQEVRVHYTGWTTDGRQFDSSRTRGTPFAFPIGLGCVIRGWDEGVATMKVGGKRRLIIPSDLGYGARGSGAAIPPNATLIFDVEVLGTGDEMDACPR